MRAVTIAQALIVAAACSLGSLGGCAAEGNDIPVSPVTIVGDGGKRNVINGGEDGGGTPTDYDANELFDSGGTKKDGSSQDDSSTIGTPCGFDTSAQGGTCTGAIDIGSISGDTDAANNTITYTGKGSQWLVFTVREDASGFTETDLSLRATLTGPSGTNYDLYGYVDPGGTPTSHSCTTVSGQSNNAAGQDDVINLLWDDNKITQPSDDTRLVSIQIEHITGPCGASDEWTLTVQGNTQ